MVPTTIGNMLKKMLFSAVAFFCVTATTVFAHPHAFVECAFSFVMDEKGMVGFRQRWVLDAMTTVSVLDVIDSDRDAILSAEEKIALRNLTVDSLGEYHYFTAVRINDRDFPVQVITDFTAELKDNKLIYDFLVPCPVAAVAGKPQQVKVAVYDDSFYTYVAYATEKGSGIDPSKDPLFANREAPARPEDFKRFAKAVGIGKFQGEIRITGDTGKFKTASEIKDAPEMAYFHGQIVPQAFVLRFEAR